MKKVNYVNNNHRAFCLCSNRFHRFKPRIKCKQTLTQDKKDSTAPHAPRSDAMHWITIVLIFHLDHNDGNVTFDLLRAPCLGEVMMQRYLGQKKTPAAPYFSMIFLCI